MSPEVPGGSFVTPVALDRDTFVRRLISSLGHLNEGILGSDVAGAYIMNVGLLMGAAIEEEYKRFWEIDRPFTLEEYAHVIVDLKQKIGGNFSLVSADSSKVVVQTTSCPFDEFVRQSPSLCFMTSSVFGGIAARNFGYAKVVLHQRIALGAPGCCVTVHLQPSPEAGAAAGQEYFPDLTPSSPDIGEQLRFMDSIRRLREQLAETSARWEELLRGAADAFCVVTLSGVVLVANASWRELLGVEGDELTGVNLEVLAHPDDLQELRAELARVGAGERVVGSGCRLRRRDGTWRDVLISAGPVRDERGGITSALCIARDVTAEREAQRLKDHFLATASHEIRTPVTTIKGLTELLLRQLEQGQALDLAQLTRRLELIRREADRLALLGADLHDAARLQMRRLAITSARCDLREIVAACVAVRAELLPPNAPVRITVLQPAGVVMIQGDSPRLEQIIATLLDNAVKYSPHGGEVTVRTEVRDSHASLTVTDRGIGIPEQDLPQLFSPFFRGSNASARNFMGIGLGLHLSKAIAEAHGGDLSVISVEGRGSAFTLTLPLVGEDTKTDEL